MTSRSAPGPSAGRQAPATRRRGGVGLTRDESPCQPNPHASSAWRSRTPRPSCERMGTGTLTPRPGWSSFGKDLSGRLRFKSWRVPARRHGMEVSVHRAPARRTVSGRHHSSTTTSPTALILTCTVMSMSRFTGEMARAQLGGAARLQTGGARTPSGASRSPVHRGEEAQRAPSEVPGALCRVACAGATAADRGYNGVSWPTTRTVVREGAVAASLKTHLGGRRRPYSPGGAGASTSRRAGGCPARPITAEGRNCALFSGLHEAGPAPLEEPRQRRPGLRAGTATTCTTALSTAW